MSEPREPGAPARPVTALFQHGRLTAIPRRAARREQLLTHLTETLFETGRTYTESEVNAALRSVHDDCAALRRYLVDAGHLTRTPDCLTYRRTAPNAGG